MNREEKLKLSAEMEYGHAFGQGLFAKFFEQSLWRFVHSVRRLKPMLERVKGGPAVIYGGLPIKSFEALLAEGGPLAGAEITEYGWRWVWPAAEAEISPFEQWRSEAATALRPRAGRSAGRDILAKLTAFNLDKRRYPTGRAVSVEDMASLKIKRADFHGEWNYNIVPR